MLTKDELMKLLRDVESSRVERTVSTSDTDKFCEAVCAFANDMPDSKQNGYLFVGAFDGGLYGRVNRDNFPDENDYRNPIIADAIRTLGYVNRFGRGIGRVKVELVDNGNGEPSFDTEQIGSFRVSVRLTKYAMEEGEATLPTESSQENGVKSIESSQRLEESEESRNESKEGTSKSEERMGESVPVSPESVPRGSESVPRDLESVPSDLESSPSRAQIEAWAHAVLPSGIRSDGLKNMISVLTVVGSNKFATTESIASEVGLTQRGVKKITAALQKLGVLKHVGPSFGGHWELVGFEP